MGGNIKLFERSEGPMLSGDSSVVELAIAVYDLSDDAEGDKILACCNIEAIDNLDDALNFAY